MAEVYNFSKAYKTRHGKTVSWNELSSLRAAHTYYVTETTLFTQPVEATSTSALPNEISGQLCTVKVYQHVNEHLEVDDRIILNIGDVLRFEFTASLATLFLFDCKVSDDSLLPLNQTGFYIRISEMIRIVGETTKSLAKRSLLGKCGFAFGEEEEDEADEEQDPDDVFWLD